MKKINFVVLIIFISVFLLTNMTYANKITHYSYEIINTYPHDKNTFTQGLYYYNGIIYEGTGRYGKSDLRKYKLKSDKIIAKNKLDSKYFGEGITILNKKIYQSTWKEKTIFIYDLELNLTNKSYFPFHCWGLTDNNQELIMSNGTNIIRFLDPRTFKVKDKIEVSLDNKPVNNINELEYINNKIYANIWQDNIIIIINPDSGLVEGTINLKGLIDPQNYSYQLNVLNGIAYDKKNDRLFVTGKLWPLIFEIKLIKLK